MCCCGQIRIIQTGGAVAPFTFNVTAGNSPYNLGAGVITGPIAINLNDTIHFYSLNTIDFQVIPGSANVFAEARLDPNVNNIITVSPLGLLVDGSALPSGVNIYNSDGTITDPTRLVTIGDSTLTFDAQDVNTQSNIYIDKFATNLFTFDVASQSQQSVTTDTSSAVMQSNNPNDSVSRYMAQADAIQSQLINTSFWGSSQNTLRQFSDATNSYFDFSSSPASFFELRLDGDPGVAGYTIISQGPGSSPVWGPSVGGGGSFGLAADLGGAESVTVGVDTLAILGANLISTTVSASDTVTVSMIPGANGQIAYTIAGTPTWAFPQDILDIINFSTDVNWNFNTNDWNVSNVDNWTVQADDISFTSNTFDVSSPVACFSGITQNDTLTRFLVQDIGGCLAWRDGSTITATINNPTFVTNQTWDFSNNDWSINNIDNWNVDSNVINFNAPVICFTGISQNDTLTRFLVQDVGGCLSWRDGATVAGDRDWLTIQTTNAENFEANNAYRVGGIGVTGYPHASGAPFDTNPLIFDIEVAGGTLNTIGINATNDDQDEAAFQIIALRNAEITQSAISVGSTVGNGFVPLPNLFGPAIGPMAANLLISHKSRNGGGAGDIPVLMFYGDGSSNTEAGIIVSDLQSANFQSIPVEQFTVNASTKTPRIFIANDNPIAKNASLYFSTFNNANRGLLSMGEYINAGGSIIDSTSDSMFFSQAGAGNPIMSSNPVTGGWFIGNGFPQIAGATDLLVDGANNLVTFADYPQTRDDSGATTPINFLYTNLAGDILSAPIGNILCNVSTIPCAPVWDFNNNSFTWNNVDQFSLNGDNVDFNLNNFTVNSGSICFPALTQNDALTRVLVMDALGGCLQWRDAATLGGGGSLTAANSGLTVFGGNTVRLGGAAPNTAPLIGNRFIDLAGNSLQFEAASVAMVGAPGGQSTNLRIGNNYGAILTSNGYDNANSFPNTDFVGTTPGIAVWNDSGTMKRVEVNQMPYKRRRVTASGNALVNDTTIEVDTTSGPVTITLPVGTSFYNQAIASEGNGKKYTVKKVAGASNVTVVVAGAGTIDGAASKIITGLNDAFSFQANSATSYEIIYDYIGTPGTSGTVTSISQTPLCPVITTGVGQSPIQSITNPSTTPVLNMREEKVRIPMPFSFPGGGLTQIPLTAVGTFVLGQHFKLTETNPSSCRSAQWYTNFEIQVSFFWNTAQPIDFLLRLNVLAGTGVPSLFTLYSESIQIPATTTTDQVERRTFTIPIRLGSKTGLPVPVGGAHPDIRIEPQVVINTANTLPAGTPTLFVGKLTRTGMEFGSAANNSGGDEFYWETI